MKPNQLDRIIKLVRRTGDRFVIMDKDTDQTMVLMNLDEYENLLNDTSSLEALEEEDMLNKLNHDISRWQKNRPASVQWPEEQPTPTTTPVFQQERFGSQVLPQPDQLEMLEQNEFNDTQDEGFEDEEFIAPNEVLAREEIALEPIVQKTPEITNIPLETGQVEQVFDHEGALGLPEDEEEKFYLEPVE